MLCISKFPVVKKFLDNRGGGGVSRYSVEIFLSHRVEKFRKGIFYWFINLGYRKNLDKGGGSIKILRRKFFVPQCRIFPRGNPLLLH